MVPITTTSANYCCSYLGVMEIYFSVAFASVSIPEHVRSHLKAGVLLAMSTSLALP